MNLADLELHNIVELDSDAGYPGPLVRRIPRNVTDALENGALVAGDSSLCEVRFVPVSGHRCAIVLNSLAGGDLFIYRGNMVQNHVRVPAGAVFRHILDFEFDPFAELKPEALAGGSFSPHVWRIVFDGPTLLYGIERMGCTLRPPRPEEKPARRWLAYGSSITHGYTPVTRRQCYVAQTARRLGVDVINQGLSGSCWCEPGFSDYLASRQDYDFITCELGVNMREGRFTPEEFERRARYLVSTLTSRRPGLPVVLITPFTSQVDFLREPNAAARNTNAFRTSLRAIARDFSSKNVHLVEGTDILNDFAGLTCDFVHPSTEGHTLMAENLATALRKILPAGMVR